MIVDAKVKEKLEKAGFKKDPCQFPGERMNFIHAGTVAKKSTYDNAHSLELHYRYNGSGKQAFGGADKWPALKLEVAFQVGQEKLRERLAVELAATVDKFMKNVGRG